MKKLFIASLIFISLFSACTSKNTTIKQPDANKVVSTQAKQKTQPIPIALTEDTVISFDGFDLALSEYKLVRSKDDLMKDATNLSKKLDEYKVESLQVGFDLGLSYSDPEVSKRDSYLIIVLNYNPQKIIKSQRDSVIPDFDVEAFDNEGDEVILIHNSMEDQYIQFENPLGVLLFKTFDDTETITFNFDGDPYILTIK